jgi:hypothetical protein
MPPRATAGDVQRRNERALQARSPWFEPKCAHFFEYPSNFRWLLPGHGGSCKTAEIMERQREYSRAHPHRESKESRKKSNRKYRISSYGLTQEQFDLVLASNTALASRKGRRSTKRGAMSQAWGASDARRAY